MNTQNTNSNEQNNDITSQKDDILPSDLGAEADISSDTDENNTNGSDTDDSNTDNIRNDIDETQQKKKTLRTIIEYTEIFAFSVLAVLLIFSFMFRVCVVDGSSMYSTLDDGQRLLTENIFYSPKQGDIIVFYEGGELSKPLVKRVIATGGQTVSINYNTGEVSVDGEVLSEDYIFLPSGSYTVHYHYIYDTETGIMTVTVPDGKLFVMGDNRNDSLDSRSSTIGCIDQNQVLGKVILRLSPFTVFS